MDRRGFIKLAVGAAAGFHLTPLPWKIIDDISIWTQNWPFVPRVTRYPEYKVLPTVCNLCPGGCGIKVRTVNAKRVIKVEGLPGAPLNQGKVCPVGASGPQYQNSLARYQGPLKRIGSRGSGSYQKISWEEALTGLSRKLAELRDNGEAHTVALISGRNNDLAKSLSARFMSVYGSPNLITMPSHNDALQLAEQAMIGSEGRIGYDLENSRLVLSFGCGLIEGWGAPVRSIQAYSSWRAEGKTKLIQIDTQASLTASKADQWVAVAPGTEAALALGLAQVMVSQNLYDKKFVKDYSYAFNEFSSLLSKDYTPKKVAALTGVPVETIVSLAREFAQTKGAVAISGKGKGNIPSSVYEVMAILALNALKGNINQPGGLILRKDLPLADWPEAWFDDAAKEGAAAPRLDLAGSDKHPLSKSLLENFTESILTGRFYPVSVLIVDQANPAFFGADPGAFRQALAKIPYVVTFSSWADDTSIQADLVLPQATHFEGPSEIINPPTLPFPMFALGRPVLENSSYNTKPIGDIYLALAKDIGGSVAESLPFEDHQEMAALAAAGLFEAAGGGLAEPEGEPLRVAFGEEPEALEFENAETFLEALGEAIFWYDPTFDFGDLSAAFQTRSKKFEFFSQGLKAAFEEFIQKKGKKAALTELGFSKSAAQLYMPHFEPYISEKPSKTYPLLMVPVEEFKLVTSALGNSPYLTKLLENRTLNEKDLLVVQINPQTAKALQLHEMDRAWLKTPKGQFQVLVHLYEGARPDVVYAPLGLGHTGFGYYLRGRGINPMELVETRIDPLSGQAIWWGTSANLIKV